VQLHISTPTYHVPHPCDNIYKIVGQASDECFFLYSVLDIWK